MLLANAADYPIAINALIFAIAAAVIWHAGARLTHALDAIASRTGLGHAFVGMLLLGGITSLPELANVITASSIGNPALAINNLLGSAAINVLLLAIADALVGRRAVTSIVAQPSTMMMATLCMIILIIIAAAIAIEDVKIGPLGLGSALIGIASVFAFWVAKGHDERSPWTIEQDEASDAPVEAKQTSRRVAGEASWFPVVIHGALIFAAGYALSQTGDAIAEQAGITSAVVGFALIGTATSLPELVTILTALKLGRPEMAFAQVLGTNFINLSLLPLGDLIFEGEPVLNTLGKFEILSALLGAILIGILMVGLLEHRNRTVWKMGVDSAIVIIFFGFGTGLLATV